MTTKALEPVFINCPFDATYEPIFKAIIYAVHDCGFVPRCALEESDFGDFRLDKIARIIKDCRFGIHNISNVAIDPATSVPRFNMPFELGLFLGCRRFGGPSQKVKPSLVMDAERYRYRDSLSDIAGQDVRAHGNDPKRAMQCVRDWLRVVSKRTDIPGAGAMWKRYVRFKDELPAASRSLRLHQDEVSFLDQCYLIETWLRENDNAS